METTSLLPKVERKSSGAKCVVTILAVCLIFAILAIIFLAVELRNSNKDRTDENRTPVPVEANLVMPSDTCSGQILDMAVVGAGASGVYTAYKMSQNTDWNIHIFDTNHRIGGRTFSIAMPGITDFKADLGGMRYKKSSHTRVHQLGKELGLTVQPFLTPTSETTLLHLRGELLGKAEIASGHVPYSMTEEERRMSGDGSIYSFWNNIILANDSITEENPWNRVCTDGKLAHEKGILNAYLEVGTIEAIRYMTDRTGFQSIRGNNWNYAEMSAMIAHWLSPEEFITFKEGFQQLTKEMMSQILQQARNQLFLNHELTSVSHDGNIFKLQFTDKEAQKKVQVCAKNVVLGLSAEALKRISFEDKEISDVFTELLPSVNQSPACKVYLVYNEPWWRTKGRGPIFDQFRADGKHVEQINTDLPVGMLFDIGVDRTTGKAMLGLYTDWWLNTHFWTPYMTPVHENGSGVKEAEFIATDKMVDQITGQLATVFHIPIDEMPQPETVVPHCWYTAPYWTAWHDKVAGFNFSEVIEKILQPVNKKGLYIVGEAFSNYQEQVEGALETAQNLLTQHFNITL